MNEIVAFKINQKPIFKMIGEIDFTLFSEVEIMKHLLLEVYCDCKDKMKPLHCIHGIGWPGSHCFVDNCKYLSYANCPNEIAYAGTTGVVEKIEDFVGFGGDMYPDNFELSF